MAEPEPISVAHYVRRYPGDQLHYIWEQVRTTGARRDVLLVRRQVGETNAPPDAFPIRRLARLKLTSPMGSRMARIDDRITRHLVSPRVGHFVGRAIRRDGASLVHAHFGTAGAEVASAPRAPRVPLVTSFYGVDASARLRDSAWRRPYRRLFATGSLFIVLGQEVAERLVHAGCPADKVVVWNLGLDFNGLPVDTASRLASAPPRLLCVARFAPKKGHPILLEAFAAVRRQHQHATLTLIGFGPLRAAIADQAAMLGLGEAVRIVDTEGSSDFPAVFDEALSRHDVFVLPSVTGPDGDDESGPALTLVRAQAAGLPVVSTEFVGADRCAHDERTAFTAPADPEAFGRRILEVLAEPETARRIAAQGSDFAREHFSLDRQLEKLDGLYRELLR